MLNKTVKVYYNLLALKFVPDWFVTSEIIEKLDPVFSNYNIVFVDIDSLHCYIR